MDKKINITINGFPVQLEKGKTILEAAEATGIKIPTLCYHKDYALQGIAGFVWLKLWDRKDFRLPVPLRVKKEWKFLPTALRYEIRKAHN
jgi:hypothetical protein